MADAPVDGQGGWGNVCATLDGSCFGNLFILALVGSFISFINFMALFSIFSGIREAFTGCGRRNFEKSDFSGCGPLRGRCMHVLAIAASAICPCACVGSFLAFWCIGVFGVSFGMRFYLVCCWPISIHAILLYCDRETLRPPRLPPADLPKNPEPISETPQQPVVIGVKDIKVGRDGIPIEIGRDGIPLTSGTEESQKNEHPG